MRIIKVEYRIPREYSEEQRHSIFRLRYDGKQEAFAVPPNMNFFRCDWILSMDWEDIYTELTSIVQLNPGVSIHSIQLMDYPEI